MILNSNNISTSQTYAFQQMQRDKGTKSGNDIPGYATLFRGYDTEGGRWNMIDPKWRVLPSESPYIGMGNNPVNMVDPWGDKQLRSNDAKIMFANNGDIVLRTANLHDPTISALNNANNDMNNWHGNIGVGNTVLSSTLCSDRKFGDYMTSWDGSVTGTRYNTISGVTYPHAVINTPDGGMLLPFTKGPSPDLIPATKGIIAIQAISEALNDLAKYLIYDDLGKIREQLKVAKYIDKRISISRSSLPAKYQTTEAISNIENVILTGENYSKDPKIKEIGDKLYREYFNNEPTKIFTPKVMHNSANDGIIKRDNTTYKPLDIKREK